MNKFSKEQDKMMQGTQIYLNHGLIPLVQLMDNVLNNKIAGKHFKMACDSFSLLAYAHWDISYVRRQLLKSSVAEKVQNRSAMIQLLLWIICWQMNLKNK